MLYNELLLKIFRSDDVLFAKSKLLATKILADQELLQTNILKSLTNTEFKQICLYDNYAITKFYDCDENRIVKVEISNSDLNKMELICMTNSQYEYTYALLARFLSPADYMKILDKIKQCETQYDVDLLSFYKIIVNRLQIYELEHLSLYFIMKKLHQYKDIDLNGYLWSTAAILKIPLVISTTYYDKPTPKFINDKLYLRIKNHLMTL